MIDKDKKAFFELIANVYAFYRQDFSEFAGSVWWEAMRPFDLSAVRSAMSRHCVNPDSGQFLPKPADVVKMLSGGTADQAALAWAKVDRAVRSVGTYADVVFDDALIHRCVSELGGWVWLGQQVEDDWPFIAKRFETIYRSFRMRNETPEYQKVLVGIANSQNSREGKQENPPVLIGNPDAAAKVLAGGSTTPLLTTTRGADVVLRISQEAARNRLEANGNRASSVRGQAHPGVAREG